jgi:hypothetical protein
MLAAALCFAAYNLIQRFAKTRYTSQPHASCSWLSCPKRSQR